MMGQTFTLREILYGATAVFACVGFIGGGYHLWLSGKIASIAKLWKAKDALVEKIDKVEGAMVDRLHSIEMESVNKFATKSELADAINRFERHLEQLEEKLDSNQRELLSKLIDRGP